MTTTYTPVGNPAWHYNDNPLTPSGQQTWDQYRGYQGMIVSTGTAPDPITKTQYTYFQGMNGDYLSSTSTRSVSVTDTRGDPAVADLNQYAGMTYETQVFNGSSLVTDTIDTPWTSSAQATHALSGGVPSQQAFLTGQAETQEYTPLASGATRETETQYTHDSYGRVTQENELNDVSTSADDECVNTTYADNTSAWILDLTAEVSTVSVNCSTTPSLPADAISDDLTFYDGSSTLGATPTVGNPTMTQKATSYVGSAPQYTTESTTQYDEYGRTVYLDRRRREHHHHGVQPGDRGGGGVGQRDRPDEADHGHRLQPGARPGDVEHGRCRVRDRAAVRRARPAARGVQPGQTVASNQPNQKYTYAVSDTAPTAVDTYTLNPDGTYRVSEELEDSLLRVRETQTATVDGGRDITDDYYNTDGWESEAADPYYNSSAVSPTFVQAQVGDVPSATGYTYDGAGRKIAQTAYNDGTQTWQTTYVYGGNFVTTVPPAGGTAQTTVDNALGQQTDLIQYLAGEPTNYLTDPTSDYTDTKDTYYPTGQQATQTDAAGDQWSWAYNLNGDQTSLTDPDSGTSTSTYDADGHELTSTDARGKQTTYVYDKDGRRTGEYDTTSTSTLSTANEVAGWTYDATTGLVDATTSYSGGDVFTDTILKYNSIEKPSVTKDTLTGESSTLFPSGGLITSYAYNLAGNLSTETVPAVDGLPEEQLSYGYDEYSQPTSLTSSGGASWTYASAVGYDEYGKPTDYTLPTSGGNVWVQESYDPQTQALDDVQTTDSTDSSVVDNLQYSYQNASGTVSKGAGLVTEIQDSQQGGSTVDTQCFTYDYAQRLSMAWTATDDCAATPSAGDSPTVGGTDAPYWQSWTYNAAGDRLTQTDYDTSGNTANDTTTTYHYPSPGSSDQPDTLTNTTATGPQASQDTASYTYDASGDTTAITGGPTGNETLTWNDQDRLATDTTSAGTTSYVYDAAGNQLVVRDPGSTTVYLDGDQLTLNTATNAVSGVRYYTLGDATIAERTSAGAVSDLVPDRQGTDLLAISTTAAQTVTRRQYLPFGGVRGTAPTWVGGTKGYVGGDADTATGLENLGARDYDAGTGRFLSIDSIFEADDPNETGGYDYSGNDPVTNSDPSGKMMEMMTDGGGGGAAPAPPPPAVSWWRAAAQGVTMWATWMAQDMVTRRSAYQATDKSIAQQAAQMAEEQGIKAAAEWGSAARNAARAGARSPLEEWLLPKMNSILGRSADMPTIDGLLNKYKGPKYNLSEDQAYERILSNVSKTNEAADALSGPLKVLGGAAVAINVGLDIYDTVTAPPGQRTRVAARDAGGTIGGFAGAAEGAEAGAVIGSFFGPGPGTAIGFVAGGLIGGFIGSSVGQAVGKGVGDAISDVESWF